MESTTGSGTSSQEIPLTRPQKEKLLQKMYFLPHWIAIIRHFGHKTIPMPQAQEEIKPIAEEFGQELVANACESLVEISSQAEKYFARLKPHVRRMAFQIIGPEPLPEADAPLSPCSPPPPDPHFEAEPTPVAQKGKSKRSPPKRPPPAATISSPQTESHSTILQQYRAAKDRHPDMLLLFRMGDFIELFAEDAEEAHKLLGLTLTTRDRTLAMAGFPHHQLESYLHTLLKAGKRVAVCDQVEEAFDQGTNRCQVARIVTPGSVVEEGERRPEMECGHSETSPTAKGCPVRQPRHAVLKGFEAWLNESGYAFVAAKDVEATIPGADSHGGVLDYLVMRDDEKLLVTVRPRLQAKQRQAIADLQKVFGLPYKAVRFWPKEGPKARNWQEYSVDV